jgi:Fe-Mn family superoxide dismutase
MLRTEPSGLHSESPFPEQAFQSRSLDLMDLGETLYPLFCISVHEHAWMSAGYGVWGKEEWLKTFWTVVDWGKVSANFHRLVVQHKEF